MLQIAPHTITEKPAYFAADLYTTLDHANSRPTHVHCQKIVQILIHPHLAYKLLDGAPPHRGYPICSSVDWDFIKDVHGMLYDISLSYCVQSELSQFGTILTPALTELLTPHPERPTS